MPGTAAGVPDDLSHGPLDDGRARIEYMRDCFRGYDDWTLDATDAFAPWRDLLARPDENRLDAVVVWGGDNVSEATFLRMVCGWLDERRVRLRRAAVPGRHGRHYVAVHTPAELAGLYATAQELTDTERAECAEDFVRIRGESGLLRRWEEGRIVGVSTDRYDPLLLQGCTTDWIPAVRVVGTAMGRCDGHNLMSDLFFSSRLQALLDSARVEAAGSRARLRSYAVRLPSGAKPRRD
jgi:hypothetical protein